MTFQNKMQITTKQMYCFEIKMQITELIVIKKSDDMSFITNTVLHCKKYLFVLNNITCHFNFYERKIKAFRVKSYLSEVSNLDIIKQLLFKLQIFHTLKYKYYYQ